MLDGKSIINNFPKFAQKLAIAAVGTALSLSFINANPAKAATFRYTLDIQEGFTDYTEGKISVDDVTTYDGTYFTSAINPATGSLDEVVGLFKVLDGSLGEPVTLEILRDDYRVAGRDGIITLKYLASPQALDTIPSEIAQLPEDTQEGLSEVKVVKLPDSLETYDVLVIPAEFFAFPEFRDDEGKPTPIVALGWSATKVTQPVPESDTVFALLLLGGSLVVKRLLSPKCKRVFITKKSFFRPVPL